MHTARFALLAVPAVLLLTACDSNSNSPRMQRVSLSTTIGSAGMRASPSGPAADVIVGGSGGSVRITSAQLMLADVRLEGDGTCGGIEADVQDGHDSGGGDDSAEVHDSSEAHDSAESGDEHDCEALNVGPVTVDLPLDGTTKVALDALVPAGTYTGLRSRLAHVNVAGVFTDATGADHGFAFTSGVGAEVEMDFPAPVTVGAGTNNLTIDVNVGSWFTDASGAVIDPTNPQNHEAIEHAIRASFRAFEDDNHDGNDDHEEEGR